MLIRGPSATAGRDTPMSARAPVRRRASSCAAAPRSTAIIECLADDQSSNRQFLLDANRIRCANLRLRRCNALGKALQNARLASARRNEMEGMNRVPLSDAIHAADALLEAHRIPWKLDVDDQAAALVQVQPFTGRVGGEENRSRLAGKPREHGRAFPGGQAAVEHDAPQIERVTDMQ